MPLHPTSGHSLVVGSTRQWFYDQLVDTRRPRRDFSSHRHHPSHHRTIRSRNFTASLSGLFGDLFERKSRIDRHIFSRRSLGQYSSSSLCHHLPSSSWYVGDPFTTIVGSVAVAFVMSSNSRRQHRRHQQRQSSAPNKLITEFYRKDSHELQQIDDGSRSCLKMIRNNNNNNNERNNRSNANTSDDDDLFGGELFWLIVSLGTAAATAIFGNNTTACLLFSIFYASFAYGLGKPYILQDYLENDREDDDDDDESPPPVFLVSYVAALLSANVLTPLSMTSSTSSSQSLSLPSISSPIITASGSDDKGLGLSLTLLGVVVLIGSIVVSPRLLRDGTNEEIMVKPKSEVPTTNRNKKEDSDDDDDEENFFLDASKRNEQRLLDLWDKKLQQDSDDVDFS